MSSDALEEELAARAFDRRLFSRLLALIRAHRRGFVACVLLALAVAGVELTVPALTQAAIDRGVVPRTQLVTVPNGTAISPARGVAEIGSIDDRRAIAIDAAVAARGTTDALRRRGGDEPRRVLVIPDDGGARSAIVRAHPASYRICRNDSGDRLIVEDRALPAFSAGELLRLRADDARLLRALALALCACVAVRYGISWVLTYLVQLTGQSIVRDLRGMVVAHLLRLPMTYFERNPVGRLVTRATNDSGAILDFYATTLVALVRDAALIIGVTVFMAWMQPGLCLLVWAFAPVVLALSWIFKHRARDAFREFRRKLSQLNAYLAERIAGMRVVQVCAQEARSVAEMSAINEQEYRANIRQLTIFAIYQPFIYFIGAIAASVVLWRGGVITLAGGLTPGALFAFLACVELLFAPVRDLADKYNTMQGAMAAAERLFQVLDEPVEDRGRGLRPESFAGAIEFRDVWFAYGDGESPQWVLRGISFTVTSGQRAALIGPTGAGKSTIIALLLGFHRPQRGAILIDGRELADYDLTWLRRTMAVVFQDVFLFADDVVENLRLLDHAISSQRVEAAAHAVSADAFIRRLPDGYATKLGERGSGLAAGERQLLSFARALTVDPRVLILDEATANIDSQTEAQIQVAMMRLLAGRTALIIAHRLSTIRACDQILVLRDGVVAERGTHRELMALGGLYQALDRRQHAEEALRRIDAGAEDIVN